MMSGVDGISGKVLKIIIDYIVNIQTGYFPNSLKKSKIIPIYKSGQKNLVDNYRPIALTSIFIF